MKLFGYFLIGAGFIGGSLIAVLDPTNVNWPYFLTALTAGIVGVALVRISIRNQTQSAHQIDSNMRAVAESLENIVCKVGELSELDKTADPYSFHSRIDDVLADDLTRFVEARETIAHVHGLQRYADVMSVFASGERAINRAWAASADGYIDEVRSCLQRACGQFADALRKLEGK